MVATFIYASLFSVATPPVCVLVWPQRFAEGHRRGDRHHPTVVSANQLPPALMDLPVMAAAEQDLVFDLASAAAGPVDEMMSVAPGGRPLAVGPLAVPVARDQRPPPRSFDDSLPPPHADPPRALHKDPGEPAVAGPALTGRGWARNRD